MPEGRDPPGPERLVIDLASTGFLDAAGRRVIVRAWQALTRSCRLVLC